MNGLGTKRIRSSTRFSLALLIGLVIALGTDTALATIFQRPLIYPMQAGKNRVRWRDFDWKQLEIMRTDEHAGGVRFFFYESERPVAEVAAAALESEFERLESVFGFQPEEPVPYFLYSSHLEFEETNIFRIGESTMGVTSTTDLKMSLAYWGDFAHYAHVSSHESVHQFMIQRANRIAKEYGIVNPLKKMPLWFIEGMAEFYSRSGLDPETRMIARDIRNHARKSKHRKPPFFADRTLNYIQVYKLGQLRYAYLDQRIEGGAIRLLDESYRMDRWKGRPDDAKSRSFEEHVLAMTGFDGEKELQEDWESWLDDRFPIWANAGPVPEAPWLPVENVHKFIDDYAANPDGRLLIYRSLEPETGIVSLTLARADNPKRRRLIARDGGDEIESLHFMQRRTFTLGDRWLAFSALYGERDRLIIYPLKSSDNGTPPKLESPPRRISIPNVLEIGDLAFSPDETQVAFIGLQSNGYSDVFILDLNAAEPTPRRLTNDVYYEAELNWSADGLVCSSDRTPHGQRNIFQIDPRTGEMNRLLDGSADQRHPAWDSDGTLWFESAVDGVPNLFKYDGNAVTRVTTADTGLFRPQPTPDGLFAIQYYRGRYRLVKIDARKLDSLPPDHPTGHRGTVELKVPARADRQEIGGDLPPTPATGRQRPPWTPQRMDLSAAKPYKPFKKRNWGADGAQVFFTSGEVGAGFISFSDALRDHTLGVNLAVYGDFSLTDAAAVYYDRSRQLQYGIGAFHLVSDREDRTFPGFPYTNLYREREFGLQAALAYPFSRQLGIETVLSVAGVQRFDFTDVTGQLENEWQELNGGTDLRVDLGARLGYDNLRYHAGSGPVSGLSLLAFGDLSYIFDREESVTACRLEANHYLRIWRGMNLWTRFGTGASSGGRFGRQYRLFSIDNLRGFEWNDSRLRGDNFLVGNVELQFPLSPVMPNSPIRYVEGLIGFDAGSVFDDFDSELIKNHRLANMVFGFNLMFGPLAFRFHYGKAVDIGGHYEIPNGWENQFSIRWAFY